MRAVVQRVRRASVTAGGQTVGRIGCGLVVLVGVGRNDTAKDVQWLADKVAELRCFDDDEGKLNRSVEHIHGEILVVSQFTLYGDCRRGRRPGFSDAAPADQGEQLYDMFVALLRQRGLTVETGVYQAHMVVELENDGPVTLLLDSEKKF